MLDHGHQSYIAYGRGDRPSQSELIKIGGQLDVVAHGLKSLIFDRHGFGSEQATKKLIEKIKTIAPDIIHLHNLHGYYLHVKTLFEFIAPLKIPIVWTLHDCWAYTGHCSHYENIGCNRWETECYSCPKKNKYPKSLLLDRSNRNYHDKKHLFNLPDNVTLVLPSKWLFQDVARSFLMDHQRFVIHNGVDLNCFQPYNLDANEIIDKKIILGVASVWQESKGLFDFYELVNILPSDKYQIVLIGLTNKQIEKLPEGISGIVRTESTVELAKWYTRAAVFVNPTYLDNFPTTNIEALACGTPVITYRTGGSPEAIDEHTGRIVAVGDVSALKEAILAITAQDRDTLRQACRQRALSHFNKKDRYLDYLALYEEKLAALV